MPLEPWLASLVLGFLGLMIGSFLNVVVWRLPKVMERTWRDECAALAAQESVCGMSADDTATPAPPPASGSSFNLWQPPSHCPHCQHRLAWRENIPVLSYVFLRGRCSNCKQTISVRYPLVECATALLFAVCGHRFGFEPTALAWAGFCACLLTLALIDLDTTLLPDAITLPLIWAGLVASALQWTSVPLAASLWGAVAGYMSLWSIYWLFKLLTGKEGMGYGDFKLLAALGAWFGVGSILPLVLISSVVGASAGLLMIVARKVVRQQAIPFGPYLALAGLVLLWLGPARVTNWLALS